MNVYCDIETIPCEDPVIIAEISKTITAPAQYKKQESIDEWMRDNRESALKERLAKTSFDGLYGRIACISWAIDNEGVLSTTPEMNERECIESFFYSVYHKSGMSYHGGALHQSIVLVGHNIAGFDLPFLKHRAIILGIEPPASIKKAMKARPWDKEVADTMLMWSQDRERRVGLSKLCRAFGIEDDDDIDGSMVAELWKSDPERVIRHCKIDVEKVRKVYSRLAII